MSNNSEPNRDPLTQAPLYTDDNALQADVPPGGVRNLRGLFQTADIIADVTLVKAISHTPAPLRIIITDYEFTY